MLYSCMELDELTKSWESWTRRPTMSWRSDRGNAHEVNSNAELSAQSAERWEQLCDETRAENAARSERRPGCLRDSTLAGAAAGVVGCAGMLQLTRTRSAALRKLAGAGGMAFRCDSGAKTAPLAVYSDRTDGGGCWGAIGAVPALSQSGPHHRR